MTIKEKNNLLTKDFNQLWTDLWREFYGVQYRTEEKRSLEKLNKIKEGIHMFD